MTEAEKRRALAAYRMEQADEALRSADVNLAGGMVRSAVNRAYYAMFYAVLAPLAARKRGRDWLVSRAALWTYLENRAPSGRPPASRKGRNVRRRARATAG